jgi:hypothetical protein
VPSVHMLMVCEPRSGTDLVARAPTTARLVRSR